MDGVAPQPSMEAFQKAAKLPNWSSKIATEPQIQMPDFEAVADLVATRTADAVQQHQAGAPDFEVMADSIAMRAFEALQRHQTPAPDLDAIADSIVRRTSDIGACGFSE